MKWLGRLLAWLMHDTGEINTTPYTTFEWEKAEKQGADAYKDKP